MQNTLVLDDASGGRETYSKPFSLIASSKGTLYGEYGPDLWDSGNNLFAFIIRMFTFTESASVTIEGFSMRALPKIDGFTVYRNKSDIKRFIELYPEVRGYIRIAESVIRNSFPGVNIAVELSVDPDNSIDKSVNLNIVTTLELEDALRLLNGVDKELFEEHAISPDLISVDLELV